MPKYTIKIRDAADYEGIEAENEDKAIEIALDMFSESCPDISAEEEED